ncbi:sigma-E factor negative regulatory protein [Pseudoalteromonas denitrificans]|uniref:Anti-sigma-E factor RseA n=1 Tax=Pseudoalteromonas denitrificans DSM 6059 TaxID=1123010 RepID=A0A1I1HKU9_9GAMM|nr:RseA family anti-sigma factor [Pseudoalteromonas denitrificans]SFC21710.1 sigma-E factor negative regulatory protein RseA [Pseudoalteromonas denitrificans DSM 6059]
MTIKQLTEQDKAEISAFLDAEEGLSEFMIQSEAGKTLEKYSLIGDVMRANDKDFIHLDIASKVASQLEHEPIFADFNKSDVVSNVQVDAEKTDNVVAFNWKKPFSQIAIAASVAMFAIVGVQNLPTDDVQVTESLPLLQLQTTPFGGVASPVSYSSEKPALQNASSNLRKLQQQRIGALVMEHQRQTRIATSEKKLQSDDLNKIKNEDSK